MYISIDGPEATGKSTTVSALVVALRAAGYQVVQTKEPGSGHSRICTQIRQMILAGEEDVDPLAELLLFLADRVQHLNRVVVPALQRGDIVISDRSGVTGLVYALAGAEPERHQLITQLWRAGQVVWPDHVFISQANPGWAAEQLASRPTLDQIEMRSSKFHDTVRKLYDQCVADSALLCAPPQTRLQYLPETGPNTTEQIIDWIMEAI